tara:strand:+ start:334 stop:600 length:267 start_codon:yes stop_codon:yes gene_type:complete
MSIKPMRTNNESLTLKEVNHVLDVLQKDSQEHNNYFDFIIETKTDTIPLLFRKAFQEYIDKCSQELENQKELTNYFGTLFNQLQEEKK